MSKRYFKLTLLFLLIGFNSLLAQFTSTVNVKLNKVYDATWMDGGVPSVNTFKIKGVLEVISGDPNNNPAVVESLDLLTGQLKGVDYANERCILQVTPHKNEFDWHDNFGYAGSATTNNFKYGNAIPYKLRVHLKVTGYQKKQLADYCNCDDKVRWDPSINCFKIFGKTICLGGIVGPFDKYCDNTFDVYYVIDQNSTPYQDIITQTISSVNDRFGVELKINFTAPAPLVPDQQKETTASSWATGNQPITNEVKCGGEDFTIEDSSGFAGVQAYEWFENGTSIGTTPVRAGSRYSSITRNIQNHTSTEMEYDYSVRAIYAGGTSVVGPATKTYVHPARPTINSYTYKEMSCHGVNDDTLKLYALGGNGNYRYSIENYVPPNVAASYVRNYNGTVGLFDSIPGGDPALPFNVIAENIVTTTTHTTVYSCASLDKIINLRQPNILAVDSLHIVNYKNGAQIQCKSYNNGRVETFPSGGTQPYRYSIDNYATTQSNLQFNNLKPISYTFSVVDTNGCKTNKPLTLTEPDTLLETRSPSIYNGFNIHCKSGSDGVISFNTTKGGTAPYRYSINSGTNLFLVQTLFNNLSAGLYKLQVRDINDCFYNDTITLIEPKKLVVDTVQLKQPLCFGSTDGSIQVKGTGGVELLPYNFWIDNYGDPYTKTPANPAYYNDSSTFSGLITYNYKIKVQDKNNCLDSMNVFLNQPIMLGVSFTGKDVQCSGQTNGSITAYVLGGSKPYRYNWTNGGGPTINTSPSDSSISNLIPGSYNLLVTDGHNCNVPAISIVHEPSPLWAVIDTVVNVRCYDGQDASITINSGGGVIPHNYSLNGGPFMANRNVFDTLSAGTYTVTVKDAGGCILTLPPVTISMPNALTAHATVSPVSCSYKTDGSAMIDNVTGGSSPYQYTLGWDGYFSTYPYFFNLAPGTQVIRIMDSQGCVLNKNIEVAAPDVLVLTPIQIDNAACNTNTGSAIVQATGGTSPYTYSWLDETAYGNSIVNLPMGVHPIKVLDAKQCMAAINVGISDIGGPVVNIDNITPPSCYNSQNGSVTVSVTGGNAGYGFQWYDPGNQITPTASNLKDSTYLVKVVNTGTLCGTVSTILVKAPDKQQILVDKVTPSLCHFDCKGSISVYAAGGTAPYVFTWNDPNNQIGGIASDLCEGTYTVHLSDANGCSDTQIVQLINPDSIAVNITDTVKLCIGQSTTLSAENDGSAYLWTGPGFSCQAQSVTVSQSGNYSLTVTNQNKCVAVKNFTVLSIANLLKADFLVKGKNTNTDTIAFVDVSYPRPEKVEWVFTDNVTLISIVYPNAFVSYPTDGTYLVKMTAYLGSCVDQMEKEVTITAPPPSVHRIGYFNTKNSVTEFTVFPNPNNGEFTATVQLDSAQAVKISIYDMQGNLIQTAEYSGNDYYSEKFNLSIAAGIYMIRVETAIDNKSLKFSVIR